MELMVAIMLSQQATDASVNRLTPSLFAKYPTIEAYRDVPLPELEQDLCSIGLYNSKAKNIKAMAKIVASEYQGVFPPDQESLESLPGVGRKTANVFLAEWYHLPRIAVDTHVLRVSKRLGLAPKNASPLAVEQSLSKLYPQDLWIDLHHKFVIFGRYFCKAKKPRCHECPIINNCLKPFP